MGINTTGGAKYEIGKFYKIAVNGGWGREVKVPAMCVRKLKRKIVFRHLVQSGDKGLRFTEVTRWWWLGSDGKEHCHTSDVWYHFNSRADETANEPKRWQEVCGAAH